MDILKTAREIGLFEVCVNLAKVCKSTDVLQRVGASMPLPDEDIAVLIPQIAQWLHSFGKIKYMFLSPEIALIEEIAKLSTQAEIIIAIPSDLEDEAKDRLRNNLPRNIEVTVIEEPHFHPAFYPKNGLIVACGYSAGGRPMALVDTYRMLEHYSGFLGKKVFIPYKELETGTRYDGWLEIGRQRVSTEWRVES